MKSVGGIAGIFAVAIAIGLGTIIWADNAGKLWHIWHASPAPAPTGLSASVAPSDIRVCAEGGNTNKCAQRISVSGVNPNIEERAETQTREVKRKYYVVELRLQGCGRLRITYLQSREALALVYGTGGGSNVDMNDNDVKLFCLQEVPAK